MADLPFIDEHAVEVAAPPSACWEALLATAGAMSDGAAEGAVAWLLGTEHRGRSGVPGESGSTIVGFEVAEAKAPRLLVLEGRHRFSRYRLTFTIVPAPGGAVVAAVTHAEFPGLHGRAYRALVIGTRGHVLATQRILRSVKGRAERARESA